MKLLEKKLKPLFRIYLAILSLVVGSQMGAFAQIFDCEEELFSKKDKKTRLFGYVNMLGEYRIPPTFLKANPFSGKYAVVQQGKKFGVINCDGILVVPADYDELSAFINSKGWFRKGNLWGFLDTKGKVLIQPQYEDIEEINTFSGAVSWVKKNGVWGLINRENGRMMVNPVYETFSTISDSAGIARKKGLLELVYFGDGRIIISDMKQIKKAGPNLFIYESQDKKYGVFNSLAFITIRPTWDTLFLNGNFFQTRKFGKSGLLTFKGTEIFEPQYESISPIHGGFVGVKKDGKYQVLNLQNTLETPNQVFTNGQLTSEGLVVLKNNEKSGLWDLKQKKWLIPFIEQTIRISNNDMWLEVTKSTKAQLFDFKTGFSPTFWDSLNIEDGPRLIRGYVGNKTFLTKPPEMAQNQPFDQVNKINDQLFLVQSNHQFGIFTSSGTVLFSPEYESIEWMESASKEMFFTVKKEGQWGAANQQGKLLIPTRFESILPTSPNYYFAKQKGKWGLLSGAEKWITEPRFDSITYPKKSGQLPVFPVVVWKKGKSCLFSSKGEELSELIAHQWTYLEQDVWGQVSAKGIQLFNNLGKQLNDAYFQEVQLYSEGKAPIKQADKWGFANAFGKIVIPCQFEEVLPYQKNIAYAKSGGKWGVLKQNGSWLVKPVGVAVDQDEFGNRKLVIP